MNYSRFLYYQTFVTSIINKCSINNRLTIQNKNKLLTLLVNATDEIDYQIQKVYSNQRGGYWPITDGDELFISFMQKIKLAIADLQKNTSIAPKRLQIFRNILSESLINADAVSNHKIKVVFLLQETVGWPSFESVYEAFSTDPRCEAHLIYVPFEHVNNDKTRDWFLEYKNLDLLIIHCKQYQLSKESPDIAFFIKPYDCIPMQFYIDNVEKIIQRNVYIPYFVNWMAFDNIKYLIDYHFRLPLQYKAWKIFDAPSYIKEYHEHYGYHNGDNVEIIGHPRFDIIHKLGELQESIPAYWKEKIKNRKVFLWNTHVVMATVKDDEKDWSTYRLFGEKILKKFAMEIDAVLLWRPHPSFFTGLINNGDMSIVEMNKLLSEVELSDNIILDKTSDYRISFVISDALISDASSFLVEYLVTGKPICYTYPKSTYSIVNDHLLPAYYNGSTWEEINSFINMVKNDIHNNLNTNGVLSANGLNSTKIIGQEIKDICINDMISEEVSKSQNCFCDDEDKKTT